MAAVLNSVILNLTKLDSVNTSQTHGPQNNRVHLLGLYPVSQIMLQHCDREHLLGSQIMYYTISYQNKSRYKIHQCTEQINVLGYFLTYFNNCWTSFCIEFWKQLLKLNYLYG